MGSPTKIRATLQGEVVEVKVLMQHVMETGQRKTVQNDAIPAHFIQQVLATHQGKTVLSADWGASLSRHPFLAFKFMGGARGDTVQITWVDNRGDQRTDEATIH